MPAHRIQSELDRIEREETVRVLYACESGSRAWGFESADSDYDVRFIFARPAREYLRLDPPRDVIERPIDDNLDISGWDLFKACRLLMKTNPPLLEWLDSPIVYREDRSVTAVMRAESAAHFNLRACGEHYLSMARSNWKAYIHRRESVRKKKYLYALRPLLCVHWLLRHETPPPTRFQSVMDGLDLDPPLRHAIDELIFSKLNEPESATVPPVIIFNEYLQSQLEAMPDVLAPIHGRQFPPERLNAIIRKVLGVTDDQAWKGGAVD